VEHPAEYLWSSYHGNVLDKHIALLIAHHCYQSLGTNQEERKRAYWALFEHHIPALTLQAIRDATNKAWVLGENRFNNRLSSKREEGQSHWLKEEIEVLRPLEK
jgi:putative transposase